MIKARVEISHLDRRRGQLIEVAPDDPGLAAGYLKRTDPVVSEAANVPDPAQDKPAHEDNQPVGPARRRRKQADDTTETAASGADDGSGTG